MLSHVGDVISLQQDFASIQPKGASNSVKQRGLASTVGTNDRDKFAFGKGEVYIIQRYMCVRCAL